MKKIIVTSMFFILAISINAQTYLQEDFDADIPMTWTITDEGGTTGDSWISDMQGGANSLNGSNVAIVDSDANGDGIELIETLTSPVFDTTGAVLLYLDFDQFYNNGGGDSAIVEVFDGTNWVEVLNQTADIGGFNAPDVQHIDITAYSNANMQIRFVYNDGNIWAWYWLLDNIIVYNSTCDFPSGITVDNITDISADITWTTGGTESNWEIVVQAAGTGEPTGSGTSTTTNNPYNVTGLTAITDYEAWVRSDCGTDGFSFWSGPINFRTFNTPPPPPVGVTCVSGSSSFIYTAEFDTFDGWTGDLTNTNQDGLWEVPNDSGSGATGADAAFSGASFMNYESSGGTTATASAVSPSIDLTSAIDGAELSFYMHAFGADMGVLNVGVSNSAAGPFTNLFSWTGDLQTDGAQPWVPIGINLDAYLGQSIFVEFSHTGTGDFEGDMSIDLMRVETCGSFCIAPSSIIVSNIGGTSADIDWNGNNGETSWEYVLVPAGSGEPSGPGTTVGTTTVNETGLNFSTDYEVWLRADCGSSVFSSWAGPVNFTTTIQSDFTIDCTQAPTNITYCYDNNDTTNWTFTSSDGSPVRITFNAGGIEGCCDEILIYDGVDNTGTLIFQGNNGGDLSGLTFDSVGDSMFFEIDSDGSISCASGSGCCTTEWDFTVACATCVNPEATYTVVSNCVVGPEFFVDVDLTNLGSAASVTISDDQGSTPQTVSATGIVTFGPFANNVPVVITIDNDDDANCQITSAALTQDLCLDTIVDCTGGPIAGFLCYSNDNSVILTYTSSDGTPLNLAINQGEIEGDPFDFLLVTDGNGTVLYNDEGNDGDISGLTFQSITDTITIQILSDGSVSCESGAFPDGIDFTVSCATCVNPAATYQVIDDCANGDQFLVNVNVTTLGDATSLTISNNIDATTESATATGVYQVGPFLFGVDVIISLSNDQDGNCVINSSAIQLLACPPDNDNPCDATIAQVNADDSCTLITSGTLLEGTDSGIPNGSCTGNADDDVWYEFTALNDIQIISILNIDGGGFFQNIDHALYEGTCNALVELYCSDAEASVTPILTIGNTYYVRIFSADSDPVDYTFDLCIRPGSGNVLVDQTTYTPEELIIDVLIDSPCAQISNITYSTGLDFGEENGIGYFSNPDGGFPFEEGLLLTSGDASRAAGPNVNALGDGSNAWPGDADLSNITGDITNNATIIEFDFVPLNDELSFDFLMASEEYDMGGFECQFSDAFAFLLTDSNSITTNLAVVPGTTDPILVTNIHPDNGVCPAVNEQYFGEYIPDNLPPISFDGRTAVFTAFSPVNIGETYHIKLVIADAIDTNFDSGVFLKAGSFDIGEVDLGGDITIAGGTAVCEDEPIILDTSAPNVDHVWYQDGFVIDGEISSTLMVTEAGLYTVQIIFSPSCIIDDEVLIEFLPNPVVANTPDDLTACSTTNQAVFDLNVNTNVVLGPQNPADFIVTYHASQTDADNSSNTLASPYTNTSNPQVIYVRIEDITTGCYETTSFNLSISSPSHTAESADMIGCDNDDDGIATFDLVSNDANILNGQDASQFIVTYHSTQADAMTGAGDLASPYDSSGETIFVRVETVTFVDCYVTNSFDLIIGTEPLTSFTTDFDYEVCPGATVPITIAATPVNYTEGEVTINWYLDNGLVSNENGLTLPVIDAGDYEIEVIFNDTGCSNSTFITVIELPTCVIPQGISPNGDNLNETFDLSSYGVTKLEIFNRNGTLVYSKKNYTNEWFGQTDGGEELPVGTYFYTMEYQNGKTRSAWIYIQREN